MLVNVNTISKKYPNTEFLIIGIPDKFYWSSRSYPTTVEEYEELGYRFNLSLNADNPTNIPLANLVSNRLKFNGISYIYLPKLLAPGTDIINWFYYRDMHINSFGNKMISKLLKEKIYWK